MKRTLLFAGMTILTLGAVAWAAVGSWMVLTTGLGPNGIWSRVDLGMGSHSVNLSVLAFLLAIFLPLLLVGAFWVWRWGKRLTTSKPDGG